MTIFNFQFSIFKKRDGFTLVELLVAITLFSIAVSIAIGGFVRALRTQRELISLISANSNASLAIEQMAREMRTGTNFSYTPDCPQAAQFCGGISFTNANGEDVVYERSESGALSRRVGSDGVDITAENVEVQYTNFALLQNDQFPPRITISLGIGAKDPELVGNITNIQTSVSSRGF